jgi:hypothetical protein
MYVRYSFIGSAVVVVIVVVVIVVINVVVVIVIVVVAVVNDVVNDVVYDVVYDFVYVVVVVDTTCFIIDNTHFDDYVYALVYLALEVVSKHCFMVLLF